MVVSYNVSPAVSALLPLQRHISSQAAALETETVEGLLRELEPLNSLDTAIAPATEALVRQLRERGGHTGIEAFLHEYGLKSNEGVAIMCLAEALLRIPDVATADRLIHDKLEAGEWQKHLGHSESLFVNASSWGLLLTGKIVRLADAGIFSKLAARVGEPVIREALKAGMRFIGSQFVLGENIGDALRHAEAFAKKGYRFSYDILGEGARTTHQALNYVQAYREAIETLGKQAQGLPLYEAPGISVKLSALHPRFQLSQHERVLAELLPRLKEIVLLAKENNLTVAIDAEESSRFDIGLMVFAELFADAQLADWNGLGFVLQAYQKRAFFALDYLSELARATGKRMPVRLVKGAYWDSEIKAAQMLGFNSYPVFTRKEHTDVSYLACAAKLLQQTEHFYPQFATHNARTLASVQAFANRYRVKPDRFEFQRLHGMGERLHDLVAGQHACRIYAPVGPHKDLLAYLIRRLLENSANTSFVNLLMDEETTLEELLENPVSKARQMLVSPIPLPRDIFGARKNSTGRDLGNIGVYEHLRETLASPLALPVLGDTETNALSAMLDAAQAAFGGWSATPTDARARMLEIAADRLEDSLEEWVALLVQEGRKTVADSIAEVREAVDFCRYYAQQARQLMTEKPLAGPTGESNALTLHPRGVFACISPWNFPLAIFTGQVAAALVTGNCVIAKPAEQTPCIASYVVKLLHACGVPAGALQLAIGSGGIIGAALVSDARISGVAFTGSVEAARSINKALAQREGPIVPFIAETGGINAMVVDSSALLEQTVDDIVLSAFGSAGQRCSALRMLYVQNDVAGTLTGLLQGAMLELSLGSPALLSTDIGPVIDGAAYETLMAYAKKMSKADKTLASIAVPEGGYFVPPCVFEVRSIRDVEGEMFGPILHVAQFGSDELERVCDEINGTGYGLTFGIQSRIGEHMDFFTSRIRAGNIYINRPMTGAVVGVQPFGGEGLSGTGPKAGGPHTLLRFVTERTVSVNTAAIGGNVRLLAGAE